jgi:hypothetical protein
VPAHATRLVPGALALALTWSAAVAHGAIQCCTVFHPAITNSQLGMAGWAYNWVQLIAEGTRQSHFLPAGRYSELQHRG